MSSLEITLLWLLAGLVFALVVVGALCGRQEKTAERELSKARDDLAHDRADFAKRP